MLLTFQFITFPTFCCFVFFSSLLSACRLVFIRRPQSNGEMPQFSIAEVCSRFQFNQTNLKTEQIKRNLERNSIILGGIALESVFLQYQNSLKHQWKKYMKNEFRVGVWSLLFSQKFFVMRSLELWIECKFKINASRNHLKIIIKHNAYEPLLLEQRK